MGCLSAAIAKAVRDWRLDFLGCASGLGVDFGLVGLLLLLLLLREGGGGREGGRWVPQASQEESLIELMRVQISQVQLSDEDEDEEEKGDGEGGGEWEGGEEVRSTKGVA